MATKPFALRLIEAVKRSEARVRVAAVDGLAKLESRRRGREDSSAPSGPIPRKPMEHARTRCGDWLRWKVKDADDLLADALKVSADHHSIAATALGLMLEAPGAQIPGAGRDLQQVRSTGIAAIYGYRGIPTPGQRRPISSGRSGRAGRRSQPFGAVSGLERGARTAGQRKPCRCLRLGSLVKVPTSAAPLVRISKMRSPHSRGREANPRTKDPLVPSKPRPSPHLERQAADLELKTKELRNQISALKHVPEQGGAAAKSTAAATPSNASQ